MGRDVVTKSQKLDPRTNTADYIVQAADWLVKALETDNPALTRERAITALRWLEQTGVVKVTPPRADNYKFRD